LSTVNLLNLFIHSLLNGTAITSELLINPSKPKLVVTVLYNSFHRYNWLTLFVQGLGGKVEGKRPLGRPRRKWEGGIRMDLREGGWGCGVDSVG
jgi:hypothetical protein